MPGRIQDYCIGPAGSIAAELRAARESAGRAAEKAAASPNSSSVSRIRAWGQRGMKSGSGSILVTPFALEAGGEPGSVAGSMKVLKQFVRGAAKIVGGDRRTCIFSCSIHKLGLSTNGWFNRCRPRVPRSLYVAVFNLRGDETVQFISQIRIARRRVEAPPEDDTSVMSKGRPIGKECQDD